MLFNSMITLPSILSLFFQYSCHCWAEVKRLIMMRAILAAPAGLQPKAMRFNLRAISRIILSIMLEVRGVISPVLSQRSR